MVFTRSPTHTWAQPTLVQCSYNMQSLSLGPKLLSVNPSKCGEHFAADGGSLRLFEKIPLLWSCTWAFHSREKTGRTSSQVHSRPQDGSLLSSRTLLVWRLTWLPSLSLPLFPPSYLRFPRCCFYPHAATHLLNTCVFRAVVIQKSERNSRQ